MRRTAGEPVHHGLTGRTFAGTPRPIGHPRETRHMAHCPHCEYDADTVDDLSYEGESRTLGDGGEAFVAMMICPGCEAILGFATGGGMP